MRQEINFDKEWKFHRGDLNTDIPPYKGITYTSAKTERALIGPASRNYIIPGNFSSKAEHKLEVWETVNLPHDYLIGDTPDPQYNESRGFCKYDNAWYIKRFMLEEGDESKRITILFDGVAIHATVYVNGCLMKHNFCGYTSFEVDITDVARFGEENVIAVYINNKQHEGWWYEGAGIYRHVHLIKTELISVDLWGVFACPAHKGGERWAVPTETTVRNDHFARKQVKIKGEILSPDGTLVATAEAGGIIDVKQKKTFKYSFEVLSPELWSPESPTRYVMRTTVYSGKTEADVNEIKFGFRTFYMDPDKGLFINGKHYKIKGMCGHENNGLTGKAVPDNIQRYRVQKMKEMGANGYRCSHYPQSEAIMEALDEAGFIVMAETRWFESTDEGLEQMTMVMKRDRNRPSVFFWSLGNEEPYHITEQGRRIFRTMLAHARTLDTSRAFLSAVTHTPRAATVFDDADVVGINYKWNHYDDVRKKYPNKPFLAAECCATGTTRGWYYPSDESRGYISAYDADSNTQLVSREKTWKFIDEREWVMGGYQWISFDHRGEAFWPRLSSQSGAFDMFFQKKDAFYQNLSHWSDVPMVHILPHWNFKGMEGFPISVWTYTNAERVELFLNGKSLGVREIEKNGHGEWTVPYESGKLEAFAYIGDKLVATDAKETTGEGRKLMLKQETTSDAGDTILVSCYVVDENGNEVPDASPTVSFSAGGAAKIIATGSDVADHNSIKLPIRKMWMGRITVAMQAGDEAGDAVLFAHADNLESAVLSIKIN